MKSGYLSKYQMKWISPHTSSIQDRNRLKLKFVWMKLAKNDKETIEADKKVSRFKRIWVI